jgi:hypothetical protein
LTRHGLAAPLTCYKRAGNSVGGHQLNISLNNSMAQGEWDSGALTEVFKDESLQVEGTGRRRVPAHGRDAV